MRHKEARAQAIEESIPVWEREILPDWRNVFRQPKLKQLWWKGIPTKLRGQLWEKAVGNPLQLSKGLQSFLSLYIPPMNFISFIIFLLVSDLLFFRPSFGYFSI